MTSYGKETTATTSIYQWITLFYNWKHATSRWNNDFSSFNIERASRLCPVSYEFNREEGKKVFNPAILNVHERLLMLFLTYTQRQDKPNITPHIVKVAGPNWLIPSDQGTSEGNAQSLSNLDQKRSPVWCLFPLTSYPSNPQSHLPYTKVVTKLSSMRINLIGLVLFWLQYIVHLLAKSLMKGQLDLATWLM